MASKFLESLREQKAKAQAGGESVKATLAEWLTALDGLKTRILEFLDEPIREGLLEVETGQQDVREERLGVYPTWTLEIFDPLGKRVVVAPTGRQVIGARGRVDFRVSPHRVMLIRAEDGSWSWVAEGSRQRKLKDFTRDSLEEVLGELFQL